MQTSMMEWETAQLPILSMVVDNIPTSIDAGCLNDILHIHQAVFGAPRELPLADQLLVCIKTEQGKLVAQCPY